MYLIIGYGVEKVLKRLGIKLSDEMCTDLASGKTGAIEEVLLQLRDAAQNGLVPRRSSADTTRSMPAYIGASPTMNSMAQYQMYPQQPQQQMYQPHQQQYAPMNAGGYLPSLSPTQNMMTMQHPMFQAPSPTNQMMMPPMFPPMNPNQQDLELSRYSTVPRAKKKSLQAGPMPAVAPTPKKHVTIQHRLSDSDVPPQPQSQKQPKKSVSANAAQRSSVDMEAEIKSLYEDKIKNQTSTISSLNETVDILQLKIHKLEQLLQLKDKKLADISRTPSTE